MKRNKPPLSSSLSGRNEKRPKRNSALRANEILHEQLFIPQLIGDNLPQFLIGVDELPEPLEINYSKIHTVKEKKPRKRKQLKITNFASTIKSDETIGGGEELNDPATGTELASSSTQDEKKENNQLVELFQLIEREYQEKIKMLTEKCFVLEFKLNQLLVSEENQQILV